MQAAQLDAADFGLPFGQARPAHHAVLDDGSALAIAWPGMTPARLGADVLRGACRCAWCSKARRAGAPPEPLPGIAIVSGDPFGAHALHLGFSDGHRSGVYPWAYLRALALECAQSKPPIAEGRA